MPEHITPADERLRAYARDGLLAYMQEWSEENWCAGWLVGLPQIMWRDDERFREWVLAVGGYWEFDRLWCDGTPVEEERL